MKNKIKYIVATAIFLVILIGGAAGNVILTKTMIEIEHDQAEYQGFLLGERGVISPKFQPRQYIKVVPVRQKNGND